ncbi:hypothetical protein FRE64_00690 [Euhalothece natronophila Z-M001]|uniref:REase AHJR-like domain-containing protein n=1 Tax=Euhalothece natronophila Z-M001 TaxID=522448 RepID=A0A5B8NKG0_9CHRO|nr:hypothetical protein [Euhalothece natronophila]QDZ38589.1 hypothetical protein FRE64_00690 [Euhalothece natronophila Z-M001]
MTTPIVNVEREELLKIAEEYRNQGYEVLMYPSAENLPDFLKNYCPDLVVRRGNEGVVIEVKSRSSLDSSSMQYLHNLAQTVEKNPGWRFKLVMRNSEEFTYSSQAESSLQVPEIKSQIEVVKKLATDHPASALLYGWSLVEATLRLVAEHEGLTLARVDPPYLMKHLATEGVISRSEYQLLMNVFSLRNAIAHGFKTTQVKQESVYDLIKITEELLVSLNSSHEYHSHEN